MTKPQIWVAAFLALFVLLFLLERATEKNNNENVQAVNNPVPQTGMASANATAPELISRLGCVNCHGTDLNGTQMGPNLKNISQYWSRDKLINYLRNPSSFMSSARFKEYQEQFPNTIMPSFGNIDVKELGKIADYLLKK
ncbi:MAG: cytochrome c [Ignavibacteriaceae bacterium]